MNRFEIFIMSHERLNVKIPLSKYKINIVIDDNDRFLEKYKEKFKDNLLIFDKEKYFDKTDTASLKSWGFKGQVFAYNFIINYCKENNIKYFLMLDDDYIDYQLRYRDGFVKRSISIKDNIDIFIDRTLDFLKNAKRVCAVAWSQGGDWIGDKIQHRKLMNVIFSCVDRNLEFLSFQNEDVATYTKLGNEGYLFLTFSNPMITQGQTQKNAGGFTEIYKRFGTYFKSFFPILFKPSFIKISIMGSKKMRIHHKINWDYAVPKLLKSGR